MKPFLYIMTLVFFFISCKEVLVPVPEQGETISPRVVLLEELTGVSCPNCPTGTEKIKELKNTYGDNLVVVAIHGDFLSWPTPESKYDFRFPEAKQLENYLKPWLGKPAASVNRIQHVEDELSVSNPQLWNGYVKDELESEHRVNLDLDLEYNEDTREVSIKAIVLPVSDFGLEEEVRMTVMVLESEIEDAQEDPTSIIEEYTHDHVLRDFATDWNGKPLNVELFDNVEKTFTYSYTIPMPEEGETLWNPAHMEIVAFLHSNINGEKTVFQAAEAKIIE